MGRACAMRDGEAPRPGRGQDGMDLENWTAHDQVLCSFSVFLLPVVVLHSLSAVCFLRGSVFVSI